MGRVKRELVITETNEYRVPMLPDEDEDSALRRYLDTGPDQFYDSTTERSFVVEKEGAHGPKDR